MLSYIFIYEIFSRVFLVATAKELTIKFSDESNDSDTELDALCSGKKYLSNITYILITNV